MNVGGAAPVHADMTHKRIYHYPKSPDATPVLRTVTIPTELVMGLWIAMRGEPKKPE